jgi:hypothetical protein
LPSRESDSLTFEAGVEVLDPLTRSGADDGAGPKLELKLPGVMKGADWVVAGVLKEEVALKRLHSQLCFSPWEDGKSKVSEEKLVLAFNGVIVGRDASPASLGSDEDVSPCCVNPDASTCPVISGVFNVIGGADMLDCEREKLLFGVPLLLAGSVESALMPPRPNAAISCGSRGLDLRRVFCLRFWNQI